MRLISEMHLDIIILKQYFVYRHKCKNLPNLPPLPNSCRAGVVQRAACCLQRRDHRKKTRPEGPAKAAAVWPPAQHLHGAGGAVRGERDGGGRGRVHPNPAAWPGRPPRLSTSAPRYRLDIAHGPFSQRRHCRINTGVTHGTSYGPAPF